MSATKDVKTKFESTTRQAADVTAALAGVKTPDASETYDRIQAFEAATVSATIAKQEAARTAQEATAAYQTLRRYVRLINNACVNICEVHGVVSAEYFAVVDRGDDPGLARRLEPEIRRVSGFGPPLADSLAHLLGELTSAETAEAKAKATLRSSQRELDAALLNLQGAIAQGRAVLATLGIKVPRTVKKKSEPVKLVTITPEAA